MKKTKDFHFKRLIIDREIVEPLFQNNNRDSFFECFFLCLMTISCATVNSLPRYGKMICQISLKKGTCMEKEEVKTTMGYQMHQLQVITIRRLRRYTMS